MSQQLTIMHDPHIKQQFKNLESNISYKLVGVIKMQIRIVLEPDWLLRLLERVGLSQNPCRCNLLRFWCVSVYMLFIEYLRASVLKIMLHLRFPDTHA